MQNARIFNFPANQFLRRVSSANLQLENDEVHIWLARLDERNAPDLTRFLSGDELARAVRFRLERDKKRFVAARGFLRILLGEYLNKNPREIRFEYSEYGKPSIAGTEHEIKFNLSHSDELALYGFTREREIGVDIERVKPDFVEHGIVSQCLCPQEISRFQKLSENERISFFFDCWTMKEAFLKTTGEGFLMSPNKINVLPCIESSADFANLHDKMRQTRFSIQKLSLIPGFSSALAIEGSKPLIKFGLFDD
jgi:4'-phosphopantetheinyl transferase